MARQCRSCKSNDLVEDRDEGDVICRSCGLVVGTPVFDERAAFRHSEEDFASIWGTASDRSKRRRMAAELRNGEAAAVGSGQIGAKLQRLFKETMHDQPKQSKRYLAATDMVRHLGSKLILSNNIQEKALQDLGHIDAGDGETSMCAPGDRAFARGQAS